MFIKTVSGITNGAVGAFQYSDVIDLASKQYDGKTLSLKLDLTSSTTTGTLDVLAAISEKSNGNFSFFTTGSATTLIISGATKSVDNGGYYYIPITIVKAPGVTHQLTTVPYIKFGFKSVGFNVPFNAWLCVG